MKQNQKHISAFLFVEDSSRKLIYPWVPIESLHMRFIGLTLKGEKQEFDSGDSRG